MPEMNTHAVELLLEHRAAEGSTAMISIGSVKLAEILAAQDPALDQLTMFVGGARSVERMIAGTMLPCQTWGEEMGRLSEGSLTSAMFLKRADGEFAEAAEAAPDPEPEPPTDGAPSALALVHGRLGERQSGPLFTHVVDPMSPGSLVITGLGMAWHLDEPTAFALRSSIAAGLLDLAGQRAATAALAA